ncbi:hypothetical protein Tco_1493436, partial [Tanacetum coccineum]
MLIHTISTFKNKKDGENVQGKEMSQRLLKRDENGSDFMDADGCGYRAMNAVLNFNPQKVKSSAVLSICTLNLKPSSSAIFSNVAFKADPFNCTQSSFVTLLVNSYFSDLAMHANCLMKCLNEEKSLKCYTDSETEVLNMSRLGGVQAQVIPWMLRYVVPTGKDNFIVSAGRPNMVPAGRTIVSPGSIIFGP